MPGEQSHTGIGSGLIPATVKVTWKCFNTDLCPQNTNTVQVGLPEVT